MGLVVQEERVQAISRRLANGAIRPPNAGSSPVQTPITTSLTRADGSGGHSYPGVNAFQRSGKLEDFFTSDCEYNCGCWMGPSRSGGPNGIDPFGKCPNNPKGNSI